MARGPAGPGSGAFGVGPGTPAPPPPRDAGVHHCGCGSRCGDRRACVWGHVANVPMTQRDLAAAKAHINFGLVVLPNRGRTPVTLITQYPSPTVAPYLSYLGATVTWTARCCSQGRCNEASRPVAEKSENGLASGPLPTEDGCGYTIGPLHLL